MKENEFKTIIKQIFTIIADIRNIYKVKMFYTLFDSENLFKMADDHNLIIKYSRFNIY